MRSPQPSRLTSMRLAAVLLASGLVISGLSAIAASQSAGVATTYREAYDFGFRDGRIAGGEDRRARVEAQAQSREEFKQATHGYIEERHDESVYVVAYRRGFEDGYRSGYEKPSSTPAASRTGSPAAALRSVSTGPVAAPSVSHSLVPAGTLMELELLETLSTKYNERGDRFTSRVARDVQLQGSVLVPEGSHVVGSISYLKRAGRIRGRAQISLRFEEIQFTDGRRVPIEASLIELDAGSEERIGGGEGAITAPAGKSEDATRVGQASGIGAVIGVIGGGGKGAGVGAAAGAVAGLATVLVTRGRDAQLEARTQLVIRLDQDASLTAAKP